MKFRNSVCCFSTNNTNCCNI